MSANYKTALLMTVAALEQVAPQSMALAFAREVLARPRPEPAPRIRRKKEATEEDRRIAADYEGGMTIAEISAKYDCSYFKAKSALDRCGVQARPQGKAAKKKDHANDPRALDMAAMYRDGKTLEEIGAKYGLTRERVRQIMIRSGNDPKGIDRPMPEHYRRAIDAYLAGDSLLTAAHIADIHPITFRNILVRAGHVPRLENRAKIYDAGKVERCAQLYLAGKSLAEIAQTVGIKHQPEIYRHLAHAGIKPSRIRKPATRPSERGDAA